MTQKNKQFYLSVLAITLPIAFQNMISYSVNLMDTVMLGKLGEVALSASSLANQMFFIFTVLCYGVGSGAMVLSSQYWGKQDIFAIQKITTIALKVTFVASLLFTAMVFIFPHEIMSIFIKEEAVISAGASYLRVVCISYLFFGITTTFLVILRSLETVKIAVIIYSVSFVVNVFFNYIFIFGKFGVPSYGMVGAAMGTVIARITEFIMVIIYMLFIEKKLCYRFKMLLLKDKLLFKDIVHYGLPVMLNELLWSMAISFHSIILGHMGSAIVAANSICNVVFQLATSFILGIGNASAVIIGKVVGSNDRDYAKECAHKLMHLYFMVGIISAIVLIIVKNPVISIYDISENTKTVANQLMYAYAVTIFCMAYTCPLLMGIFRGSGSTRFAMLVDVGCIWLFVPIGALMAFVFQFPPLVVFACLKLDMPVKALICFWYIKGDTWIKNVTH